MSVRISHQDYVATQDIEQLEHLIESAQSKLEQLRSVPKEKYLVVCDDWMNFEFFKVTSYEEALACFIKEFRYATEKGHFTRLAIEIQKWYPHELEDRVVK
jgi:hypothetical protein